MTAFSLADGLILTGFACVVIGLALYALKLLRREATPVPVPQGQATRA